MKQQEAVKVINVTKNTDKSSIQKLINQKLSRIISLEYNNAKRS